MGLIFRHILLAPLLMALAAWTPQRAGAETHSGEVTFDLPAAVVNDETITMRMVSRQLEHMGATRASEISAEQFETALLTLVNRKLLLQAARRDLPENTQRHLRNLAENRVREGRDRRRGEPPTQDVKPVYEDYLIQAYLERKVIQPVQVSPGELRAFYRDNIESFYVPATLTIRQILIREWDRSEQEAQVIIEEAAGRIAAGEDFAAVASDLSEGPYASEGGQWPASRPGELLEPVARRVAELDVGQTSEPFHTPLGWHIVKLVERSAERPRPFSEVQEDIHEVLAEARQREARERLMRHLAARAVIRIMVDPDSPETTPEALPSEDS